MRKLLSFLFFTLFLFLPQGMNAQRFDELWAQFDKAYDSDLPASAIEVLHAIRQQAVSASDDAQLLRALVTECIVARDLAPDSAEVVEHRILEAMAREHRPVERALWLSAYGQLKHNGDSLLASVAQPELLADASTDSYATLFEKGGDSRWVNHDLLSLLTRVVMDNVGARGLSPRKADEAWQRMREVYTRRGNEVALLLMRYEEMQREEAETAEIAAFIEEVKRLMPQIKGTNVGNVMQREIASCTSPELQLRVERPENGIVYPGQAVSLYVMSRNVQRAEVRLYLLPDVKGRDILPSVLYDEQALRRLGTRGRMVLRQTVKVPQHEIPEYAEASDTLSLSIPESGIYRIEVREDGKIRDFTVIPCSSVSPLFFSYQRDDVSCVRLTLVDGMTGEPFRGACTLEYADMPRGNRNSQPTLWRSVQKKSGDSFVLDELKGKYLCAKVGKDVFLPVFTLMYSYDGFQSDSKVRTQARVFTDRALYRPGQEVQFSGVVYSQQGDDVEALQHWKGRVSLLDPSRKEIMQTAVSTGEFGDFNEKFTLPNPLMPGVYQLRLFGNGLSRSATIRVEEYKRPTFSVAFSVPSPDSLYQRPHWELGDTLTLTGTVKTYSGVPLSGASVQWTTTRSAGYFRVSSDDAENKTEGSAITDANGRFTIGLRLKEISDETDGIAPYKLWGRYVFTTDCAVTASNGETVRASQRVVAGHRRVEPVSQKAEVPVVNSQLSDDHTRAVLMLRQPKAWVYYDVAAVKGGVITSEVMQVSDSVKFELEWKPEYGDAATAYMAWFHDGHFDTHSVTVKRPEPDKRLLLSWSSFRDRLQPGEEECWTLSVHRPDGTPADALVMARLYDASLDAFARADWSFGLNFPRLENPVRRIRESFYFADNLYFSHPVQVPELRFSAWKPTMFSYYGRRLAGIHMLNERVPGKMAMSAPRMQLSAAMKMESEGVADCMDMVETESIAVAETVEGSSSAEMTIRENFDETAFFMPALRTDSLGRVTLQFRLPESLTQWNFNAFAHDVQMNYGLLSDTVVARKELMTEIAAPRFLRHGDVCSISVTVRNVSAASRCGTLRFHLSDAATGCRIQEEEQRFELQAGSSQTVSFNVKADLMKMGLSADSIDNSDVLSEAMAQMLVKAVAVTDADAEGRRFSDGEQRAIPLLSGRVMVEAAVPFTLQGSGAQTIDVGRLELKRRMREDALCKPEVSVEYTDNPLWSVVRTVPNLLNEETLSANGLALRLYIVEIARFLTEKLPEVADLLPPGTSIAALRYSALDQLKDRQHSSGGFGWMPGFRPTFWTTVDVSLLLARQKNLTASSVADEMLKKAMGYMEKCADETVADMKRYKHSGGISETLMRYLYVRSLLDMVPRASECYLLEFAAEARKSLTMYGKGLQAQVLAEAAQAAGLPKKLSTSCVVAADLAMQSLIEHSVSTPEMGRYFDTPRAERGWKSYRIPTQVMAVEALSNESLKAYDGGWLAKQDTEALQREMMLWLLQSKRTQQWESSVASADASYALLRGYGPESRTFQPLTSEGQWEHTLNAQETKALVNSGRYTMQKQTDGVAWGSVRARYSVHVNAADFEGSGLKVERRWQVMRQGEWTDIPDGAEAQAEWMKVGSRVRQVFRVAADRDFDRVCLEAGRAACMEPVEPLSGNVWAGGLWAYRMVRDVRNDYFVEHLPKGKYEFFEEYFVDRSGRFSTGLVHICCSYAPEFAGFASGTTLTTGAR